MKPFAKVLADELLKNDVIRFAIAFAAVVVISVMAYLSHLYISVRGDIQQVLQTASLEKEVSGHLSQDVFERVRVLCQSVGCQSVILIDNSTRRIELSYPREERVGGTAILTESMNRGIVWDAGVPSAQFKAVSQVQTLILTVNIIRVLRIPLITVLLLAASAAGFFLASLRSGRAVSVLLSAELASLTKAASQSSGEVPSFRSTEGLAIYRVLLEHRDRLRRLSDMEAEVRSSREIAEVAEQIAHDIRSPLSAISLLLSMADALEPSKRDLLQNAFDRINYISDALLIRSRDLKSKTQLSPVLVSGVLEFALQEKRILLGSSNIEIREVIEPNLFAACQAHELATVISNLLNNAIEAVGSRGTIELKAAGGEEGVEIRVRDDGQGIRPEWLPHLMKRGASFEKTNGNGLGLFHAKSVVEAWGGRIEIQSEWGNGTAITLFLRNHS